MDQICACRLIKLRWHSRNELNSSSPLCKLSPSLHVHSRPYVSLFAPLPTSPSHQYPPPPHFLLLRTQSTFIIIINRTFTELHYYQQRCAPHLVRVLRSPSHLMHRHAIRPSSSHGKREHGGQCNQEKKKNNNNRWEFRHFANTADNSMLMIH